MHVCIYTYIHTQREGKGQREREGGMGRKQNINNQQRSVGLFNISMGLKFFKVKSWARKGKETLVFLHNRK